MWIASEVRLRVSIQWLMYRKRPGGRHDLPEHSFEHSNMHTSRRPASLMLTGLHTPESPVEPTGPNDTSCPTACDAGHGLAHAPRLATHPSCRLIGTSCNMHTNSEAHARDHAAASAATAAATPLSTHPLEDPDLQVGFIGSGARSGKRLSAGARARAGGFASISDLSALKIVKLGAHHREKTDFSGREWPRGFSHSASAHYM